MPKDVNAPSRQRPVSCGFCRKRKLRCSRTVPCSNCVSRSVRCDLEDAHEPPNSQQSTIPQVQILDRLDRLERLLVATQKPHELAQPIIESPSPSAESATQSLSINAIEVSSLDRDVALLESIYLDDHNSSVWNGIFPGSPRR
jgi:hypothetical protein